MLAVSIVGLVEDFSGEGGWVLKEEMAIVRLCPYKHCLSCSYKLSEELKFDFWD